MKHPEPTRGMSLRRLGRLLVALGGSMAPIRGTGELRLSHPCIPRTLRVNGRLKDAPLGAVKFVSEVILTLQARQKQQGGQGAA